MRIRTLTTDYLESHCYIIIENDHAIVIDPGDTDPVREALLEEAVTVDLGIVTHEHCDHIYGCTSIRDEFHCRVIACRKCDENMRDSRRNSSRYFDAFVGVQTKISSDRLRSMPPFTTFADDVFDGELTAEWMGHNLYIRETPGHSQGSVCIILDNTIMFSGDTLLKDDVTETKFSGGSEEQFQTVTMPWIRSLPSGLTVYPGHGENFILGERLETLSRKEQ